MAAELKKCIPEALDLLRQLSIDTYFETFADCNSEENMAAYLRSAFNKPKLLQECSNPHSEFYFLLWDGQPAGYLKLNEAPAQTEFHDPLSLEIERLYVLRAYQGRGLGQFLMDQALAMARARNKEYVWLGVWEHNEKAKRFYAKYGFYQISVHSFVMGDDDQTDYILRKNLVH